LPPARVKYFGCAPQPEELLASHLGV
jgi:hypothetical protein